MLHYLVSGTPDTPRATARAVTGPLVSRSPGHVGHAHFWERAVSRRHFVRTASGAAALVVGRNLWFPPGVGAAPVGGSDPRPIPGTLTIPGFPLPPLHVDFPAYGAEVSTITDFDGAVAAAEIRGSGVGTNTKTGVPTAYTFDADMRFMDGTYVSLNGQTRRGTFGFI